MTSAPGLLEALEACLAAMTSSGERGDDVSDMLAYGSAIKGARAAIRAAHSDPAAHEEVCRHCGRNLMPAQPSADF